MAGELQVGSYPHGFMSTNLGAGSPGDLRCATKMPGAALGQSEGGLFSDPSRLEHVKPPGSYLMLEDQPKIEGESSYPIKGGVVSPF